MATSGVTTFNLNAGDTVKSAMKLIRAIDSENDTVPARDMLDGLNILNLMLKEWQTSGPNLWRKTKGTVTLASNTASYVLTPRPVKVHSVQYRDASGMDLPMEELTEEDYEELPQKLSNGRPTQFYLDKQVGSTTIYTWPVLLTASGETLRTSFQRVVEDVTKASDDIDVPQEALSLVTYSLAARLIDLFGASQNISARIEARAAQMMEDYDGFDRENYVRTEPGFEY